MGLLRVAAGAGYQDNRECRGAHEHQFDYVANAEALRAGVVEDSVDLVQRHGTDRDVSAQDQQGGQQHPSTGRESTRHRGQGGEDGDRSEGEHHDYCGLHRAAIGVPTFAPGNFPADAGKQPGKPNQHRYPGYHRSPANKAEHCAVRAINAPAGEGGQDGQDDVGSEPHNIWGKFHRL